MFTFAWPWMVLILPLPWLARMILSVRPADGVDAPQILFPHSGRLKTAFSASGNGRRAQPLGLAILMLAWLGVTGALMQPQTINHFVQIKSEGHDLMLAVDLSGSMNALDFLVDGQRVNRLSVIKAVVTKFIAGRQGDRIGLVLFGEHAYLQAPLTADTNAVNGMLDNAAVGEAGDSTAIGDAIGVAVQDLRDRPGHDKVIVLLTDGGDNASSIPPMQAAKLAQQYGIRIYTIGVGSNGAVPIPDQDGNIVMAEMDLDEGLLKNIASLTGGEYFRATDTEALQTIYNQIDRLEKTEAKAQGYMIRTPLYRYPLGAAMALILLAVGVSWGRRARYVA